MKTLTANELKSKLDETNKLTVVNTLSPESFEKTHIPKSINVPLESNTFAQKVENLAGGKDQPVIVYCASSQCDSSTKAAQQLEQAGFTDVYDFEGGAKEWQEAGLQLV